MAAIQTVQAEGRRSDRQCQLKVSQFKLSEAQVGLVIDADQIAPTQLQFSSTAGSTINLIALVQRQVERRLVPIFIGILGALIIHFAFDQVDASRDYRFISFVSQNQARGRKQKCDQQAECGAGKSIKNRHILLRVCRIIARLL